MSGIKEPEIRIKTNVKIAVRKWIPDPNGQEIAPNGERGYYGDWEIQETHNLLTNDGRDFLHQQGYFTSGLGTNGANYIALSSDGTSPSASDTSLTGEISSGGLARSQGSVSHNSGETTTTIQKTFTATASHSDVQKSGLFTASSGGTMVHEATFSPVNLESNDQLQVTWTITLS